MLLGPKNISWDALVIYDHGHNILKLFDVWPNFPFATSETKREY